MTDWCGFEACPPVDCPGRAIIAALYVEARAGDGEALKVRVYLQAVNTCTGSTSVALCKQQYGELRACIQ
jgi:hypothetical protein